MAAVFPVEREEQAKRRTLLLCQEHLRKVVAVARKMAQMVDNFIAENYQEAQQAFLEIRRLEEETDEVKRNIMRELTEIGAILSSREDFMRFTSQVNEIVDLCEGAAFRLTEIMERKWKIPKDVKEALGKLSDALLETIMRLREAAAALGFSSASVTEKLRDVEVAERLVDDAYRQAEIKIISSNMEFPALLLLRDVAQLMEDAADKAEDAADSARILILSL